MKTNSFELRGFIGNLPNVRFTPNGKTVATFSLYTKEHWADGNSKQREKTQRHQITAWGAQAEFAQQRLDSRAGARASTASTRPSWSPTKSCSCGVHRTHRMSAKRPHRQPTIPPSQPPMPHQCPRPSAAA